MKHLGRTERGHVLAGGVMKVGDINGHKELTEAYELELSRYKFLTTYAANSVRRKFFGG